MRGLRSTTAEPAACSARLAWIVERAAVILRQPSSLLARFRPASAALALASLPTPYPRARPRPWSTRRTAAQARRTASPARFSTSRLPVHSSQPSSPSGASSYISRPTASPPSRGLWSGSYSCGPLALLFAAWSQGSRARRRPFRFPSSWPRRIPLYAIASLVSLHSLEAAFWIDAVRDLYEVRPRSLARSAYTDMLLLSRPLSSTHSCTISLPCSRLPIGLVRWGLNKLTTTRLSSSLLVTYLGGERSLLILLHGRPLTPHPWPVSIFIR